jgi:uncharacterized protein YuzE
MQTVTIDRQHQLAYVMFLSEPAVQTITLTPTINVDVCASGEIAGVEFLNTLELYAEVRFPSKIDAGLIGAVLTAQEVVISQLG